MNVHEAVRAAQEAADCSTDPSVHRLKLALEAAQHAEHQALERSVLQPPDLTGIEPPPIDIIRIKRPLPPSAELPTP